ncbi:MAG TPA: hypothetical protein VK597_10890 [Inquilinus sp.]|nr:hypothetical protein [Inquilinus sp.]
MGKKRKNGENGKKKRSEWVYFRTEGEVSSIEIVHNKNDNSITVVTPTEFIYTEASYDRKKGPKALNRVPGYGPSSVFDPDEAVSHFTQLVAIDTNTKEINGVKVSVTGVVIAAGVIDEDSDRALAYLAPFCIKFSASEFPPEKIGWADGLSELYRRNLVSTKNPVGLIVDSFMDDLISINNRIISIIDNFYLPRNVSMIYASSDAGKEYIPNKLIALADRVATETLDYVASGKLPMSQTELMKKQIFLQKQDAGTKKLLDLILTKIQ